jgi:two-component system, OmpR family, phosphate regulon response regulator PhoB
MGGNLLVVHAEARVRASARLALERAGHAVAEASRLVVPEIGRPDLILISWTALSPVAETLLRLRNQENARQIRVVIIAHRDEVRAAIGALEHGADDCLSVPFEPEELLARINACLRRPVATAQAEQLTAGPVVLDKAIHRVLVHDKLVDLAPTEFRLLTFFLENQGRVFSRAELLRRAWTKNIKAGHRTVDVHVRRLRQQLEPFQCEGMIQTVRGFGYRFSVETADPADDDVTGFHLQVRRS